MDEARLKALLHELYDEGSRLSPLPLPPASTRARLRPGAVLGAAAAVVAITGTVLLLPSGSNSPARLLPIESSPNASALSAPGQPSTSPTPSLSIDTSPTPPVAGAPGWVPAGAVLRARSTFTPPGTTVLTYQLAGAANRSAGTEGLVQVFTSPDTDGKAQLSSSNPTPGHSYVHITVSGHPAILTAPVGGLGGFSIQWFAGQKLLTVSMARRETADGITGASLADLIHVADSVPSQ
jgi:hypothetical protein